MGHAFQIPSHKSSARLPTSKEQSREYQVEMEQALTERPLTKSDLRLQQALQRKVDLYDRQMGVQHDDNNHPHPPEVRITGPNRGVHNAEYDAGIIRVSRSAAHDKTQIDFILAHETAHQKDEPFSLENENNADTEAARVIGPKQAIAALRSFYKTNPQEEQKLPDEIGNHGTLAQREQNIAKAFPNQKLEAPKPRHFKR